ncbi:hypothetical protein K440DRAFT_609257 [Wilcoxina mikolae CBS 423.85]|nr:hypothetical protein K440DRAFT_609257 [Wilcoxina mikolae CBS 423.85]
MAGMEDTTVAEEQDGEHRLIKPGRSAPTATGTTGTDHQRDDKWVERRILFEDRIE